MLPPPALGVESCLPFPGPLPPCHQKEKTDKKKYLDDLSLLEKIDLKSTLIPYPKFIGPPNINETSGHNMKLNLKKTKVISFDFSKKYNFLPQLSFPNCDPLEVMHETKLLGITITSDLNWSSHVRNICRRATKNLWVLIRFKTLGGTTPQLNTVYQSRIRSILEFASPAQRSRVQR